MVSFDKSDMLSQKEIEALRKEMKEQSAILSSLVKERIRKEKKEKTQHVP